MISDDDNEAGVTDTKPDIEYVLRTPPPGITDAEWLFIYNSGVGRTWAEIIHPDTAPEPPGVNKRL